ncbi:MAG: 50S ribosome-binding GTPase, partial [Saprospiraceae bacterium]|nr:50S ribosome-binding GTPase [Saprospiraceae bacterium]
MINGARGLRKIALVGNPNSGKSTVFNQLTGLRQKTGNFPGITVDIKVGRLRFANGEEAELIDFPGTYSLYPTSSDEKIVAQVLANPASEFFPDAIVYVADMTKLEKHLLLFTQLLDLNLPMILVLNMSDAAADLGIKVNTVRLTERFGVPVMAVSGRTGDNMQRLLGELEKLDRQGADLRKPYYPFSELEKQVTEAVRLNLNVENSYRALQLAHHHSWLPFISSTERGTVAAIV